MYLRVCNPRRPAGITRSPPADVRCPGTCRRSGVHLYLRINFFLRSTLFFSLHDQCIMLYYTILRDIYASGGGGDMGTSIPFLLLFRFIIIIYIYFFFHPIGEIFFLFFLFIFSPCINKKNKKKPLTKMCFSLVFSSLLSSPAV